MIFLLVLYFASEIVLLASVLVRASALARNRRDPVFYAALFWLLAMTLNEAHVYAAAESVLGGILLTALIIHLSLQLGLFLLRRAVVQAADPGTLRFASSTVPLIVATAIQVVSYLLMDVESAKAQFNGGTALHVPYLVFSVSFVLYMLWVFFIRYVPAMTGAMKTGFILIGTGSLLALIGCSSQLLALTARFMGFEPRIVFVLSGIYVVLASLTSMACCAGIAVPAAASSAARRKQRKYHAAALPAMEELWNRTVVQRGVRHLPVNESAPERQRLHRMFIEIRDADLAAGKTLLSDQESALLQEVEDRLSPAPSYT
jgi:hypothetical protein